MKKALLEHVHDEPERSTQAFHVGKSSLPKLSYKQAMRQFFVTSSGVHQIASCSAAEFKSFVEACAKTTKGKKLVYGDLKHLDYAQKLDRWFSLDVVLSAGAIVPLFATAEEANHAILAGKTESEVS